jgi:hypothetical protein
MRWSANMKSRFKSAVPPRACHILGHERQVTADHAVATSVS